MKRSTNSTAIVVGGGIAGLACAIALLKTGWQVRVLEQADAFGEVGAAISLWPNALRALDELGLGDHVRRTGAPERLGGLRERDGHWLMRADQVPASRYEPPVLIHRADLIEILLRALPRHALRTSTELRHVRDEDGGVVVEHSAGRDHADIIVGADGIHSVVRRSLLPHAKQPRYAGHTCWRFITEPADERVELTESWGLGEAFGGGQLRDGQVYCYACAWVPAGQHCTDESAEVRRRFGGWHAPIPQLLSRVDPTRLLRNDIYDLPPIQTFARGHVALVGDAAHAMTPALGQGGCQGLEDAIELASALALSRDTAAALQHYDARRRPRAQRIARQSRWIGQVTRFTAPVAVWLRSRLVSELPPSAVLAALERPFEWTAPRLPDTGMRA
jgi:2-polyprenyl-6-methoxyphenol hydroxylase-like FAD-dependent oxidoreductase